MRYADHVLLVLEDADYSAAWWADDDNLDPTPDECEAAWLTVTRLNAHAVTAEVLRLFAA